MYIVTKKGFGTAHIRKGEIEMREVTSCEFNMDTACVELHFSDGSMVAISTIAVENEVADSMYQRSELDWLIYNKPMEYAQLVLGGEIEKYLTILRNYRWPLDICFCHAQKGQLPQK